MKRSLALATVLAFTACSGGTASNGGFRGGMLPSAAIDHPAASGSATVTFNLRIPAPRTNARRGKHGHYVSPNTQSMTVTVNGGTPQAISLVPATNPHCTGATPPIVCTNLSVTAPVGNDTFTFNLYEEALVGGAEPPNPTLLATYTTPVPIEIVEGQVNNLGNFALDGVPGSIVLAPTVFVAPADGAMHTFTLGVTIKDASGATIISPGNYNPPIGLSVSNDPHGAIALSTAQVTAPSANGTTSVTVSYDASVPLTSAKITASAGSATATAFVNPLLYSVNSSADIVVGGSTRTITVSEAQYAGAFKVASSNTAVTTSCMPSCVPPNVGGAVKIIVTGRRAGSATVSISDTNGAVARVPFNVIDAPVFSYTGAPQTFVVPAGITSLIVKAFGAAGGSGKHTHGGLGGETAATVPVTPGTQLQVNVGGRGTDADRCPGGNGGFNGGANGGGADPFTRCFLLGGGGGGGGGATDIRRSASAVGGVLVIAGGGGGGGGRGDQGNGGAGGGTTADSGKSTHQCKGGGGGSQRDGGRGGKCIVDEADRGYSGQSLTGGYGGDGFAGGGAGGGGGYFGGGGSAGTHVFSSAGAGGGSSFAISTATNVRMRAGVNKGNGSITLLW